MVRPVELAAEATQQSNGGGAVFSRLTTYLFASLNEFDGYLRICVGIKS